MDGLEELRSVFREEAGELLADLEATALELEKQPDALELIDRMFRILHTLKGASTMYGYEDVSALAHELEDVYDKARTDRSAVSMGTVDVTLKARDCIRALIFSEGDLPAPVTDEAAALMVKCRELERLGSTQRSSPELVTYQIEFRPSSDSLQRGLGIAATIEELERLGTVDVRADEHVPPLETLDVEQVYVSWHIALTSSCGREAVEAVMLFFDPSEYEIEAAGSSCAEEVSPAASCSREVESTDYVRVAAPKLDRLVNLVGELVTAHAAMGGLASLLGDSALSSLSEEVGRLTAEMRESVLDIRMVPIGSVFGRLRRHVRDLAHELGKTVEVITEGGDTELDKTVIDRIEKPLLHILRNSLDHGIESPEERIAAGKSPAGTIRICASQSGGNVVLEISDDGRGLDLEAIKAKARAGGLVSADDELTDEEVRALLFRPGFSTAHAVTSLSGRGVGLDVVSRTVQELQGTASIDSVPSGGASVSVRLPLTLAIVEALLVSVGDERFMVPLALVEECVEVDQQAAWSSHGRTIIEVRGEIVPFMRMRDFFDVPGRASGEELAVIVALGERRFGLVVDSIEDQVQAVLKNLGSQFGRAEGLSGASILGDGGIALVLDAGELMRLAGVEGKGLAELN